MEDSPYGLRLKEFLMQKLIKANKERHPSGHDIMIADVNFYY